MPRNIAPSSELTHVWLSRTWPLAALAIACAAFYLFSYNSGYGYDALEYLVLGRSIAEGVPMYTYLPSKSPGIYYLVAGLHELGVNFDHASLAAVITGLYAAAVVVTFVVSRRWFSVPAAYAIALLTALAAPFMEMNFLQPTILFYLCGLIAFDRLLRFERSQDFWQIFAAGVALGIGIAIKSSTAFYGLAAGHFLIVLWTRQNAPFTWLCRCGMVLGAGVVAVLAVVILYYAAQGRAHAFFDWTFLFPFAHYPPNTTYIAKAYTKLLWVHAFILGCVPLLLSQGIRVVVFRHSPTLLALVFGACAYLALFKTQASHYFFPGAPFFFMFAVFVYEQKLHNVRVSRKLLAVCGAVTAALVCTIGVSIASYRPDAIERLTRIQDFDIDERPVRDFIQSRVHEGEHLLITGGSLGSTWTYWIAHRYPPPPFINADVKTIWMLRNRPNEVFAVLDDPRLALVQFETSQTERPVMEDVFGNLPRDLSAMHDYFSRIRTRFAPIPGVIGTATFWGRQLPHAAVESNISTPKNDESLGTIH